MNIENKVSLYVKAYNDAVQMMKDFEGLEPTSAFKQSASDNGIKEGEEMKYFVEWCRKILNMAVYSITTGKRIN